MVAAEGFLTACILLGYSTADVTSRMLLRHAPKSTMQLPNVHNLEILNYNDNVDMLPLLAFGFLVQVSAH